MLQWLKSIFFKEKEEFYPHHFLRVEINKIAKSKGQFDEFNKEIVRIKEGKEVQRDIYTRQDLEALQKKYRIPVVEEKFDIEEEYEFNPFDNLEEVHYKKAS